MQRRKTATVLSVGWKLSRGEAFAVLFCPLPPRGIWQLTWPLPWAFAIQEKNANALVGEGGWE